MPEKKVVDVMWDDSPVDVSAEVNFIWSIANKLRGPYRSDKYKDVIIPMTIIRRFECALAPTKQKVVDQFKANPNFPAKAMYRISGFQFYNTSEFDLAELVNDADHIAANFKSYLQGFSANVLEILMSKERGLNFGEEIDKMDKNNRLLSVVKAYLVRLSGIVGILWLCQPGLLYVASLECEGGCALLQLHFSDNNVSA